MCQSRYLELGTCLAPPLRAKSAYQVSPVYDHSTIFTPLPTNSQAVSHLAGKKTLARFWYTGSATVSHRAPFHTYTLLAVFVSFPTPSLFLLSTGRPVKASALFSPEYSTPQTSLESTAP